MTNDIANILGQKDFFIDKRVASASDYYLSGNILDPEEYIEWFEAIRNAQENETITIHINSSGGDLFTAVQFIRVIQESKGYIIASVEGACMSAATMIFLQAHEFIISNYSSFMFHNYSGGTIGKGGEMADQIIFEKKWSEDMMKDIYKDFLTEKEIESMLNGKDIWMSGTEVANRLEAKAKKINSAIKKATRKSR